MDEPKAVLTIPSPDAPRVVISYGSEDIALAEQVLDYLQRRTGENNAPKYDARLDKVSISSADFMGAIVDTFEQADAVIILISEDSIKSPWVQFELNIALGNSLEKRREARDSSRRKVAIRHDSLYRGGRVVPVLVSPVEHLPKQFWILRFLNVIDFTTAFDGTLPLDQIALRVDEILDSVDAKEVEFIDVRRQFVLHSNYNRLFSQLNELFAKTIEEKTHQFDEKLDAITRAFSASSSLLSPAHISIKERDAQQCIWVISSDLYNDLYLKEFQESIRQNYLRGLKYVYFLEGLEGLKEKERAYRVLYDRIEQKGGEPFDNHNNFDFVPLEPGTLMPFDEVVIYDPEGGRLTSAYVQLTFDQHPHAQTVYIDLPMSKTQSVVEKLKGIYATYLRKKRAKKKDALQ